MKTHILRLLLPLTALFLSACSDDDNKIKYNPEKAVREIIEILESESGFDIFCGELRALDVSGMQTNQFTVFALTDQVIIETQGNRYLNDDIKKYAIAESLPPSTIKSKTTITPLSEQTLAVVHDMQTETTYVNGVLLGRVRGKESGPIYTIESYIPDKPATSSTVMTSSIYELNGNNRNQAISFGYREDKTLESATNHIAGKSYFYSEREEEDQNIVITDGGDNTLAELEYDSNNHITNIASNQKTATLTWYNTGKLSETRTRSDDGQTTLKLTYDNDNVSSLSEIKAPTPPQRADNTNSGFNYDNNKNFARTLPTEWLLPVTFGILDNTDNLRYIGYFLSCDNNLTSASFINMDGEQILIQCEYTTNGSERNPQYITIKTTTDSGPVVEKRYELEYTFF